jgi:hypothetical protein
MTVATGRHSPFSEENMTDREEFLALISKWGLVPDKHNEMCVSFTVNGSLKVREETKVTGYFDFIAEFDFDSEGKFKELGIWE